MTPILPVSSSFAPAAFIPVGAPAAPAATSPEQSAHIFQSVPVRTELAAHKAHLDSLLDLCVERRASDVHLTGGVVPYFRIDNQLTPIGDKPLSPRDAEQMAE